MAMTLERLGLLCLLVAVQAWIVVGAAANTPMSSVFNPAIDPLGDTDMYSEIIKADTQEKWSLDDGKGLHGKLAGLQDLSIATHVDIKLVGFAGDGNYDLTLQQADLLRFLEASLTEDNHIYATNPANGVPHQLPLRHRYFFRVQKAKSKLAEQINDVIKRTVLEGQQSHMSVDVVDKLIQEDFKSSGMSYTIYLLNPKAATKTHLVKYNNSMGEEEERAEKTVFPYWYLPSSDAEGAAQGDSDHKPCPTVMWAGKTDRYAWIDFTAGPITYGPQTHGNGLVSDFTIPNLENFKLEDEDDDVAIHEDEFVAEVVSTVIKTAEALIQPSIHVFPIPFKMVTQVKVVELVYDRSTESPKSTFDEASIATQLQELVMAGQEVQVSKITIPMHKCHLCMAALELATKSETRTINKNGLRTTLHDYLDSAAMHNLLLDYLNTKEDLADSLGIAEFVKGPPGTRVVPVFLFDLRDSPLLLFDRHFQAVSFREFVVAVQTNTGPVAVDYKCGDDHNLKLDSRDASRAILSSVLESTWGVESPTEFYNPATRSLDIDHMWAIGYCPWGHFSRSRVLSFAQRDAVLRNQIYSQIFTVTDGLSTMINLFTKYKTTMDKVLLPAEYVHYVRRWHVFNYKLEKASMYLSLLNFDTALYYARSLRHEANALQNIFARGSVYVHSHMTCSRDSTGSWSRDALMLGALCVIAWVVYSMVKAYLRKGQRKRL